MKKIYENPNIKMILINHFIEKQREGKYYTIDFELPENVASFSVKYEYEKKSKKNIVDIGIENPSGELVGWAGSDRAEIIVGEAFSSDGFLSQKISRGAWKIEVGAYRIETEGVKVKYEITYALKSPKYYFGDLHVHSTASDGKCTISEIAKLAKKMKLDFVALANHNNYSENLRLKNEKMLTFIPAVEFTHYLGHVNLLGIKKPFEKSFIANAKNEIDNILEFAKNHGAIVSVNHPTCRFCPYLLGNENAFSHMEIWNGPMREDEMNAIEKWKTETHLGNEIVPLGGSDFHKKFWIVKLGEPVTAVKAMSNSIDDLTSAIKKGNLYITKNRKSAKLDMDVQGKTFGDVVSLENEKRVFFNATEMKPNEILKITMNGETVYESKAIHGKVSGELKICKKGALVMEVWGRNALIKGLSVTAISNAIYFE